MKKQFGLLFSGIIIGILSSSILTNEITEDKSNAILKILKSNCNCEQVTQFLYTKGLVTEKKEGSMETAEYELTNCKYDNLKKEIERINKILLEKVKGYKNIDKLTIEFTNHNSTRLITIHNGQIDY